MDCSSFIIPNNNEYSVGIIQSIRHNLHATMRKSLTIDIRQQTTQKPFSIIHVLSAVDTAV
jgi:hypothetical protein